MADASQLTKLILTKKNGFSVDGAHPYGDPQHGGCKGRTNPSKYSFVAFYFKGKPPKASVRTLRNVQRIL